MILKRNYFLLISLLALFTIVLNLNHIPIYGQQSNAPFVTESELQAALADVVTQEDLEAALADVFNAEACPEGTPLEGVFVALGFDAVYDLNTFNIIIQNCIDYWLSLAVGSIRADVNVIRIFTINALVQGMASLVTSNGEQISDYPGLDMIYPINCQPDPSTLNLCPNDFEITNAMIELLEGGYTLNQIEEAAKTIGSQDADTLITGIFECIDTRLQLG